MLDQSAPFPINKPLTLLKVVLGIQLVAIGLAVLIAALAIFVAHATLLALALRTRQHGLGYEYASLYNSKKFKSLLFGKSKLPKSNQTAVCSPCISVSRPRRSNISTNPSLDLPAHHRCRAVHWPGFAERSPLSSPRRHSSLACRNAALSLLPAPDSRQNLVQFHRARRPSLHDNHNKRHGISALW